MKIIIALTSVLGILGNAFAFDADQIKIHGFVSQGYLKSDSNNYNFAETEDGTFQFNEMGINFTSQLSDNLRMGIQLLSRDLGDYGNNDVSIDWAFGDYRFRNWLGLRAGKMKRAFGLYNRIRDIEAARTSIFLPPSLYTESGRDVQSATTGIGIYGTLPWGFDYEIQYGTTAADKDSAIVAMIAHGFGSKAENVDADENFIANIEWNTPLEGLKLGFTYSPDFSWAQTMNTGILDFSYEQFVFSAEFLYHGLACAAEYKQAESEAVFNQDIKLYAMTAENYYLMMNYRFSEWFQLGSYYSVTYPDKNDRDGEGFIKQGRPAARAWMKDFAMTARFDMSDNWIFKLEGHIMDGLSEEFVQTPDNEASEDWFLFAAKVTFSF
jgi:hypothetical protein